MNYRHTYMRIIAHAKSEQNLGLRKKGNGNYYESHHILPRSLFPLWTKRKSNIVLLTAREHFFCHQLLYKIYPTKEMRSAMVIFLALNKKHHILSSREYETLVKVNAELMSDRMKGVKKDPKSVKKSADARRGAKRSEECRKRLSEIQHQIYLKCERSYTSRKDYIWINNGTEEISIKRDEQIPSGYRKGRLKRHFYTNGIVTISLLENEMPPEGFYIGKQRKAVKESALYTNGFNEIFVNEGEVPPKGYFIKKSRIWCNNGIIEKYAKEIPEGFLPGRLKR